MCHAMVHTLSLSYIHMIRHPDMSDTSTRPFTEDNLVYLCEGHNTTIYLQHRLILYSDKTRANYYSVHCSIRLD